MKRLLIPGLLLLFWGQLIAQTQVEGLPGVSQFSVQKEGQTIEYLRLAQDSDKPQKTLIFLQGSQPKPLIFELESGKYLNLPFDYRKLFVPKEGEEGLNWSLVIISPPETPLMADQAHLNPEYNYIPEPEQPDQLATAYLETNVLQTYTDRTRAVLEDLQHQPWANANDLHLVGHSQGAKIATVVAAENPQVKSVVLLGFNPYGRFE